ncbi:MAG: hypothetical protein PUE12_11475 [Oscillospiraceae bacterium]|nr:hypothetical protein [Oscillospiraceae bacterium]
MRKTGEMAYVFLFGCFLYSLIEIAARGHTHWSMTLTGGVCLAFIYHISTESKMNLMKRCFTGSLFITAIEFAVGVLVNIIMGWNVWDYSDMPANLFGQICLPFSVLWFLLCFAGCGLSKAINIRLEKMYSDDIFFERN